VADEEALEHLRARYGRPGDSVPDALDRACEVVFTGGRAEELLPSLEHLLELGARGALDDHPSARLLVAAVLHHARPDDPRVEALRAAAEGDFEARGDGRGRAWVARSRAIAALWRGDLARCAHLYERAVALAPDDHHVEEVALAHLALGLYADTADLAECTRTVERALALARERGNRRSEGLILTYLLFFLLNQGDFARVEATVPVADAVFQQLPTLEERVEWPLVQAASAVLHALRGDEEGARAAFDHALALCHRLDLAWFDAVVRAMRAEFTAPFDSRCAHVHARAAIDYFQHSGDRWWPAWAERGREVVDAELGLCPPNELSLLELLERDLPPLERARTLLVLGEVRLKGGDRSGAAEVLDLALPLFEASGARYFTCRTLHRLADVRPEQRPSLLARAGACTEDDPAYARLGDTRPSFAVRVLGQTGVFVDGERLAFATGRSELLVHMLALAGPAGLHLEVVIDRLWPRADAKRGDQSLRTALYHARQALGPEGRRLTREGPVLHLDLTGAAFDLGDARRRLHAELTACGGPERASTLRVQALVLELGQPLLPAWTYEAWVEEHNAERAQLLDTLRWSMDPARV
jgi:tetratricopeptide (TPR) repeat protein